MLISAPPGVFQVVDHIVVLRRGRVVADGIDPRGTTIEQVERVITGDLEFVDGELRPSADARAAAAAAAAGAVPDPAPPPVA